MDLGILHIYLGCILEKNWNTIPIESSFYRYCL